MNQQAISQSNCKVAFQDGAMFFDSKNCKILANYSELVKSDFDMNGAKEARVRFMKENPSYSVV